MQLQRTGTWELLAAVAGDRLMQDRIAAGINGPEIEKGKTGLAISPTIAAERFEALAAADLARAISLVRAWKPPKEVDSSPWFVVPWHAALRHVRMPLGLSFEKCDVEWLRYEARIVFAEQFEPERAWDEALQEAERANWVYPVVRRIAATLVPPTSITRSMIRSRPHAVLRLCRNSFSHMDQSARQHLRELAGNAASMSPGDTVLLLEALRETHDPLLDELCRQYSVKLKDSRDPRTFLGPCMVLVSNWRAP